MFCAFCGFSCVFDMPVPGSLPARPPLFSCRRPCLAGGPSKQGIEHPPAIEPLRLEQNHSAQFARGGDQTPDLGSTLKSSRAVPQYSAASDSARYWRFVHMVTVAILAQGTNRAVAVTQALFRSSRLERSRADAPVGELSRMIPHPGRATTTSARCLREFKL